MRIQTAAGSGCTAADGRTWMAGTGVRDSGTGPLAGPGAIVAGVR